MAALTVTAASVLPGTAAQSEGVLGETGTAGQAVYIKASDSKLWLAQCDGTAAEADAKGILLNGGGAGQPAKYATSGPINIGATTAKIHYFVSPTLGGVGIAADVTSGFFIVRLGYGTATDGSFVVDIKNTGVAV